jgi:hypothetical protein
MLRDCSPIRPSVLEKRGLDAWGLPLPPIGALISVWGEIGIYMGPLSTAADRRVRHGWVLVAGEMRAPVITDITVLGGGE